jgi:hypothetical protein
MNLIVAMSSADRRRQVLHRREAALGGLLRVLSHQTRQPRYLPAAKARKDSDGF